MKKVTLILPDKIKKVGGTSRSVYESEVEVTAEEVVKILCEQDYHTSYKISAEDVEVVSVENF